MDTKKLVGQEEIKCDYSFVIEKKGHKFKFFVNEEVDEYGNLDILCSIDDKETFRAHRYSDGVIYFYVEKLLDGMKVKGVRVDDVKIKEKLDEIKANAIEKRNKKVEKAKKHIPTKIRWAIGGDTHHIYVAQDEVEEATPIVVEKLEDLINSHVIPFEFLKNNSKKAYGIRTCLYTLDTHKINDENDESKNWYGWYEIDFAVLKPFIDEQERKEQEKKAKIDAFWKEVEEKKLIVLAVNKCWECGSIKILGKYTRYGIEKLPYSDFCKARDTLLQIWREEAEKELDPNEIYASYTPTRLEERMEEKGYKIVVVSNNYCGC